MFIGSLDIAASKKMEMRAIRRQKEQERRMRRNMMLKVEETNEDISEESTSLKSSDSEFDSNEVLTSLSKPPEKPSTSQMRVKLPSLASICDRTGVSDRAAASIASAVLQDVGVISPSDKDMVIDRMKVRRERTRNRDQVISRQSQRLISALYFDGRKDSTIIQQKCGRKHYRKTIVEEHISLLEEPESQFLGHVTPTSGSSLDITNSILDFFRGKNMSLENLKMIGCDGTPVNTGFKGGVISRLEKELKRPLQWMICLLHCNELPLRHLYQYLDGKTTGPKSYSGEIGKKLDGCEKLDIVKFSQIEGNLPTMKLQQDLSSDQKYLFEICEAVSRGECSEDLAKKNPGKLSHSRWLTTANRLLRLYVSSDNPSENLKILSEYIMRVYAPVWFYVKLHPSGTHGSRHLWRLIHFSRYLPRELLKVIDPVIQRNGYFASPENLLLGLLIDERKHIRELSLRRILKARTCHNGNVRKFSIPKINFNAADYADMISWQDQAITEPPLTKHIKEDRLKSLIEKARSTKDELPVEFSRFPCHTQAVERMVKKVTEASAAVCGKSNRDGYIMAKIDSRKLMPAFKSKKDFNV